MKSTKMSAFVVVNEGKRVIGIVSEQDVIRKLLAVGTEESLKRTTAGDIMTRDPHCLVNAENVEEEALNLMSRHNFRHVPIVDDMENKRFLRSVDVLEAAHSMGSKHSSSLLQEMGKISRKMIKSFFSTNNSNSSTLSLSSLTNRESLPAGTSVRDACVFFKERRISSVLVKNKYGATGIVTESDIVRRAFAEDLDINKTTLADIMTPNPVCANDSDAKDVLKVMLRKNFRHLPVKGKGGDDLVLILDILSVLKSALGLRDEVRSPKKEPVEEKRQVEPLPSKEESFKRRKGNEEELDRYAKLAAEALTKSEFKTAIEMITRALEWAEEKEERAVTLLCKRGLLKSVVDDKNGCIEDLERVLSLTEGGGNSSGITKAREEAAFGLCEALVEGNQIERAGDVYHGLDSSTATRVLREIFETENHRAKESGKKLFSKGQFEDAIHFFTICIRIDNVLGGVFSKQTAIAYSNRAACYQSMKHFDMAVEDCKESIKRDETYEKAWVRLCSCLSSMGLEAERYEAGE